jgi:hypothetical protein
MQDFFGLRGGAHRSLPAPTLAASTMVCRFRRRMGMRVRAAPWSRPMQKVAASCSWHHEMMRDGVPWQLRRAGQAFGVERRDTWRALGCIPGNFFGRVGAIQERLGRWCGDSPGGLGRVWGLDPIRTEGDRARHGRPNLHLVSLGPADGRLSLPAAGDCRHSTQ